MTRRRTRWLRTMGLRRRRGWPTSPVPSDADLWPGELPFTAWGQHEHGVLDLRVFDQDVWWVDIAQKPLLLQDMSPEYVANVIQMLETHAEYYYLCTLCRSSVQRYGDALLGRTSTEDIAEAAGAELVTELSPIEWLEATPLVRGLRRRQRPAGKRP